MSTAFHPSRAHSRQIGIGHVLRPRPRCDTAPRQVTPSPPRPHCYLPTSTSGTMKVMRGQCQVGEMTRMARSIPCCHNFIKPSTKHRAFTCANSLRSVHRLSPRLSQNHRWAGAWIGEVFSGHWPSLPRPPACKRDMVHRHLLRCLFRRRLQL